MVRSVGKLVSDASITLDDRHPDLVAIFDSQTGLEVIDLESGAVLSHLRESMPTPERISISEDRRLVALASGSRAAIYDLRSGARVHTIAIATGERIDSLDFNPTGTRLLTGSMDGSLRLWDTVSGEVTFESHDRAPHQMRARFFQAGTLIVSLNLVKTRLWDARPVAPR